MTSSTKILIIEDDVDLNRLLKFTLETTGQFQVGGCFDGAGAYEKVLSLRPDLIILDVMLPNKDGFEVLKQLRSCDETKGIPVIFLTAKSQEQDRIDGFEAGADDYVVKPFSPRELLLRVQALLRRVGGQSAAETHGGGEDASDAQELCLHVGPIRVFPDNYRVMVADRVIPLTSTEFNLLKYLAERPERLQNRESLLKRVWGYDGDVNTRTVDTHVKRLRTKLGEAGKLIETVHGFGYQLVSQPSKMTSSSSI